MGEPGRRGGIYDANKAVKSYFPAIVLGWIDMALCLALTWSGYYLHDWKAAAGGIAGALLVAWALRRLNAGYREAAWKAAFNEVLRRNGWRAAPDYVNACWWSYGVEGLTPLEALREEADCA